ncbi:retrovirus-related pol polyprotein from transposon TNT 1-94 [Tanacetum coccineum]
MSTSKIYQQSLADAGSETRPPMLERGSYIPWASRFRRYQNRKRDNRKWLLKALDEGPYDFKNFTPEGSSIARLQTVEDLEGDDLLLHDAKIEEMWKRVERLMRGTIQNKVDRETRFMNEFDQFVAEPGEALVSFATGMVEISELKIRLDKHLTWIRLMILFYYPLQFEKCVNASRAKKLGKSLMTFGSVAHTGSSSRQTSSYYVTHPTSEVDYDDEYQQDDVHNNSEDPLVSAMLLLAKAITQNFSNLTNTRLRASSNTRNQAIIQGRQSEKGHYARIVKAKGEFMTRRSISWKHNVAAKQDKACVILLIQPADHTSDDGPSCESAFISEVQSSSIDENNEQMYPTHTKIINSTIGNDQINSNIKFDSFKGSVNSGSIKKDTHVPDLCAIEKLARNAYQKAEKQQIFAQQVQKQNMHLTSQLEMYKERVWILENINKDNNYLKEFLEADERVKRYNKQAQSQLVRDRDIIRDLEKQRDKLDLVVKNYKQKNEELQKTHSILKRQMSEKEDMYHDTILDLEAKLKKNVDLILKLGNSLQGMFMLGPKPLSVYDQQLKHGLGYPNPYTLKQAILKCPKLYVASSLGNLEIPLNVRDSKDTLKDTFKSQQKMNENMNDPIAVANKQNCWTINSKQLNALYKDFVPQKELSVKQKYFPSSSIPSVKIPVSKNMPSESPLIKELDKIKVCFEKLTLLIQQNCKRAIIFYTSPTEIQINDFCQDQVKPILNELKVYLEFFRNLFQKDIKEMKDVFESTESELDELEKQNELLKDQLLEASLKHDVELCVLINHECVDKILNAELEKVKKKSFEIQEDLQARIKILEKDVQRCEKQSVDFQLKLQHEKEKQKWDSTSKNKITIPLDYSWISKMEKLEDENVSLDFTVQSLIKERDNAKMEYKKLFDSIKKTRSQTQKEMDELIVHVSEKTYAYGAIRAENQNLLTTISELKKRLEKAEKGMNATSRVRRPMSRDSHIAYSVLDNTKKAAKNVAIYVVQIILWVVDSGCSKHMMGDWSLLKNFIEKFIGTVRFGNDNFAAITGYGDYIHGNITICHVYYVEGLGHNLFSVGQFCDGDLEVAFCSNTCYIQNLQGDDLLTGGREYNLYTISISDMAASSPVCLMSKSTSTKSWLWHRRLSHLNFGTINDLTRLDLVDGLPKFKYGKDHLCSAYERGKSKKASHPPKLVPSVHSKLELLHMDLCGPMRVVSINGKKYILVIVDDYSRYTWVYFLRSKDETPEIIKKFIAQAQLNYKAKVCKIRTDNGTEFKNTSLKAHYEKLGIMQQFSIARTPQQNGVVERRNRTLVEAARTMLIFSWLPEFLWAEAVATACFTQNRSIIHTRYNKTPYELLRGRKPNIAYFHVFGSLCYPINDRDDLGKMKPKADIRVFIGYSKTSTGFRIYNRRTKMIMETIHVKFDELTAMASEHDCLEPKLQRFNNQNSSADTMNTPSKEDLDNLFGPMFKEYFEQKSFDTPIYSAAQLTPVHEDSPSTSSIIVDTHEAPPVITTSDEQTSLIFLTEADEFNQEDSADFDGNAQFVPYNPLSREEIELSTTALEPSNMQNFHQVQPSTHIWTKYHPLDQVIGDPFKPVMTRQRLHTYS